MSDDKPLILAVDDDAEILDDYNFFLKPYYQVHTAVSPVKALEMVEDNDYSVIISDYNMPQMNGVEFLNKAEKLDKDHVKVLITGFSDIQIAADAVNKSHVFKFISKPFKSSELINAVRQAYQYNQLKKAEKELLNKTLKGSIKVFIDLLSINNVSNFTQEKKYRKLGRELAKACDFESLWELEISLILCKIGYISIPNQIVNKYLLMGQLTPTERSLYLKHVDFSSKLISEIPRLNNISEAIKYQYRPYSGSENDARMKGDKIPFISRLLHVINDYVRHINAFDDQIEGLEEMLKKDSDEYDPKILKELVKLTVGRVDAPDKADYIIDLNLKSESLEEKNIKFINLDELSEGHKLADDIKDRNNLNLLGKGTIINEPLINYLNNRRETLTIQEPIKVYL